MKKINSIRIGDFGKVLIRFASAQIVTNFLSMLAGFLVVSKLDPSQYGQFTGVGVYMGYILFGHGGILNGLSRELPFELGKQNDEHARELASSTWVLATIISLVSSFIFLIFSFIYFAKGETIYGFVFLSYVVIGGFYLLNKQFLPTLFRTNNDFDALSKINVYLGILNLITVVLVYIFHIYGLMIRGVLLAIFEFALLMKMKPYKLQFSAHINHYKKLLKTGFPIFLVGHVNHLWVTVLNNFIFVIGGKAMYGMYALSNIVQGILGAIPNSFSQVIYPRMAIQLGEGRSVKDILKGSMKPLAFQFLVMLAIALVGVVAIPLLVPLVLPKYTGGIAAAQWMLFVPVAQSFGALNNIYNVVKKQKWYLISMISGAICGTLYVYLEFHLNGFKLDIFPKGLLIGTIIQQIMSLLFLNTIRTESIHEKDKK